MGHSIGKINTLIEDRNVKDIAAAPTTFPLSLGPFHMQLCRINLAIETFYAKTQHFPRPSVGICAEPIVGISPRVAGVNCKEMLFCKLSPLHRVTLRGGAKNEVRIPQNAEFFAWAYPIAGSVPAGDSASHQFLKYGGFIYFDASVMAIQSTCIAPAQEDFRGLMFGRGQPLPASVEEVLCRQGRFKEITLEALKREGAMEFAWVHPGEFEGEIASRDGCFAYKFSWAYGGSRYFPVVAEPVFTRALVQHVLRENEAFVVLRPSAPMVERVVVFSKEKGFDQNVNEQGLDGVLAAGEPDIVATLGNCEQLSYQEWQSSGRSDWSTLAHPWILSVDAN